LSRPAFQRFFVFNPRPMGPHPCKPTHQHDRASKLPFRPKLALESSPWWLGPQSPPLGPEVLQTAQPRGPQLRAATLVSLEPAERLLAGLVEHTTTSVRRVVAKAHEVAVVTGSLTRAGIGVLEGGAKDMTPQPFLAGPNRGGVGGAAELCMSRCLPRAVAADTTLWAVQRSAMGAHIQAGLAHTPPVEHLRPTSPHECLA